MSLCPHQRWRGMAMHCAPAHRDLLLRNLPGARPRLLLPDDLLQEMGIHFAPGRPLQGAWPVPFCPTSPLVQIRGQNEAVALLVWAGASLETEGGIGWEDKDENRIQTITDPTATHPTPPLCCFSNPSQQPPRAKHVYHQITGQVKKAFPFQTDLRGEAHIAELVPGPVEELIPAPPTTARLPSDWDSTTSAAKAKYIRSGRLQIGREIGIPFFPYAELAQGTVEAAGFAGDAGKGCDFLAGFSRACLWLGPKLLSSTVLDFAAPKGTLGDLAHAAMSRNFLEREMQDSAVIFFYSLDNETSIEDPSYHLDEIEQYINTTMRAFVPSVPASDHRPPIDDLLGYWLLDARIQDRSSLRRGRAPLSVGDSFLHLCHGFWKPLVAVISDSFIREISQGTAADLLKMDAFCMPLALLVLALTLRSVRMLVIPILSVAISIFVSFMCLLPIAKWVWQMASFAPSIMMSCAVAMSFDYSLCLSRPLLLMRLAIVHFFLILAVILSRFREEVLQSHRSVRDAVLVTVSQAGRIILLSNITVCASLVLLPILRSPSWGCFPLDIIATMGFGSAIALIITMLVNMTLVPALLVTFPRFFADFTYFGLGCCCMPCVKRRCLRTPCCDCCTNPSGFKTKLIAPPPSESPASPYLAEPIPTDPMAAPTPTSPAQETQAAAHQALMEEAEKRQAKSFWYRSGHLSTGCGCAWTIIFVALAICVPLGMELLKMRATLDTTEVLPRDSAGMAVFRRMCNDFAPAWPPHSCPPNHSLLPTGRVGPYTLLLESAGGDAILSDAFFDMAHKLVPFLTGDDPAGQGRLLCSNCMMGITNAAAMEVPLELAQACLDPTAEAYESDLCFAYRYLYKRFANPTGTAAYFELQPIVSPFGDGISDWIAKVRTAMDNFTAVYPNLPDTNPNAIPFKMYLYATGVEMADAVSVVYQLFPYMISATVCVIIVLVAVVFRSLMVPLRLVLSLAVTLVVVFGSAVFVFQEGRQWVKYVWPAVGLYQAMIWVVPVCSVPSMAATAELGVGAVDEKPHRHEPEHAVYLKGADPDSHGPHIYLTSVRAQIMGFSIVVGLGLDYDIFLFSRVYEYRKRGYGDRAALTKAIYKTGSIITAAGCIMALAFSGLMLSQEMVLNQFGFILCWSVILDTFFVRTLVVPAIVGLVGRLPGRWNWWPGRVPQGTRGELDQTDEFDAGVATAGGSGDKNPLGGESGPAGVNNSDDAQHHPSPAIDERTPLIPSGDLPV
ncbi:putative MmpL efflux pump [Paratrimastix pyriformis]|uniref:MmpL efflux pump n=1 Tax=Paratrimastix pyriformis TaxID=342808 RepID=A0ABQ8U8Y6_9EUKA|nr:putative MmpL efflux pump [Paratrimastix pyriformis]